jgi:hypothetical protein
LKDHEPLENLLKILEFKSYPKSPYIKFLFTWSDLKSKLETSIPPALPWQPVQLLILTQQRWGYSRAHLKP